MDVLIDTNILVRRINRHDPQYRDARDALKAIEARDVKGLLNAGDVLDQACETCHRKYWYRVAPTGAPADAAERPKTGS